MRHPFITAGHPDATRALAQTFWILVLSTLIFLGGGVFVAGPDVLATPLMATLAAGLSIVWAIHAMDVHTHRREIRRDPAFRRARERRGF
jgi:hypothetical protein